jgi:uncharacterized protein (TIGR03086 family)
MTMADPADIWRQAATKFGEVLATVADDQWGAPTPCDDWTVRDLVDHALYWQAMGGGILGAGTSPGDDWATIEPAVSGALDDPSNLEGVAESFNDMPKHQVLGLLIGDLLIHSWDLARAIGADDTLPPEAVESTMLGMSRMPDEMLRGTNMFGPQVEVADDASAQDKLIAFVGRTP